MDAEALRAFDELAAETGEQLFPCWVTIGGVRVLGTCPEPRVSRFLEEGKAVADGEITVWIRKSNLATAPAVNEVMTAQGRDWVVREVKGMDEWEAEWVVRGYCKN